jgi:antitoxin HicB
MNSAAKLLAAMRRQPLAWQIGDLQVVARQHGVDWRHQKSSHWAHPASAGAAADQAGLHPKVCRVDRWSMSVAKLTDYPFEVRPLADEDGGGYLVSFPDFAECIADGETIDEAISNGREALAATIAALKSMKLAVPAPNSGGVASGKFVARVPKTIHAQLATRARAEGVSLNALVLTFIAQGLGGTRLASRAKRAH